MTYLVKPPFVTPSGNSDANEAASLEVTPSDLLTADSLLKPPPSEDHPYSHAEDHSQSHVAQHVHSEASRKRIVNRLARIEGHIRGVKTMVQDDRACPDVLVQIAAIRGGLDRVARIILDEHLSECITRAVDEGNIEAEIDALKAALDRFI